MEMVMKLEHMGFDSKEQMIIKNFGMNLMLMNGASQPAIKNEKTSNNNNEAQVVGDETRLTLSMTDALKHLKIDHDVNSAKALGKAVVSRYRDVRGKEPGKFNWVDVNGRVLQVNFYVPEDFELIREVAKEYAAALPAVATKSKSRRRKSKNKTPA